MDRWTDERKEREGKEEALMGSWTDGGWWTSSWIDRWTYQLLDGWVGGLAG